jgi:hypothetical protein
MRTLYHYTCQHVHEIIGESGLLLPARELVDGDKLDDYWPAAFVWLTDLGAPLRLALGLTMRLTTCDRIAYRYRVTDSSGVQPWLYVRRHVPEPEQLELAAGAKPRHWYVARAPVPVVLDEIRRR